MVKNIMILRFTNQIFRSCWDKDHISNVQITFKEKIGTEGRGGYFDEFGIMRDVMQNRKLLVMGFLSISRLSTCNTRCANTVLTLVCHVLSPSSITLRSPPDSHIDCHGDTQIFQRRGYP